MLKYSINKPKIILIINFCFVLKQPLNQRPQMYPQRAMGWFTLAFCLRNVRQYCITLCLVSLLTVTIIMMNCCWSCFFYKFYFHNIKLLKLIIKYFIYFTSIFYLWQFAAIEMLSFLIWVAL